MTYEPRSVYEFGDDEVSRAVDASHDHRAARERGQRVADLADAIVSALLARGILPDPEAATAIVVLLLTDRLYGSAAIELPRRGV